MRHLHRPILHLPITIYRPQPLPICQRVCSIQHRAIEPRRVLSCLSRISYPPSWPSTREVHFDCDLRSSPLFPATRGNHTHRPLSCLALILDNNLQPHPSPLSCWSEAHLCAYFLYSSHLSSSPTPYRSAFDCPQFRPRTVSPAPHTPPPASAGTLSTRHLAPAISRNTTPHTDTHTLSQKAGQEY